jgi:murein L,D-transpeptidase YcbB/YkuD
MCLVPFRIWGQADIVVAIKSIKATLYYPNSVERFYRQNGYKLAWIAPDTVKTHAWDAMLLLDCVKQYGLNHEDYHPKQLLYPLLHQLIEQKNNTKETAIYDVLLTDAMVRFINDLHYGKLNPLFPPDQVDKGVSLKAEKVLSNALQGNAFQSVINSTQPRIKLYTDLQDHMRLLVGQRSGDCYVIPQALIRKMAINMERLRWIASTGKLVHLTLVVKEGQVIIYRDKFNQDKELERELYNGNIPPKRIFKLKLYPDQL